MFQFTTAIPSRVANIRSDCNFRKGEVQEVPAEGPQSCRAAAWPPWLRVTETKCLFAVSWTCIGVTKLRGHKFISRKWKLSTLGTCVRYLKDWCIKCLWFSEHVEDDSCNGEIAVCVVCVCVCVCVCEGQSVTLSERQNSEDVKVLSLNENHYLTKLRGFLSLKVWGRCTKCSVTQMRTQSILFRDRTLLSVIFLMLAAQLYCGFSLQPWHLQKAERNTCCVLYAVR